MTSEELREFLYEQRLGAAAFSRLSGVSVGAVSQWLSEKRSIPSTVDVIIKLLKMLSYEDRERLYREVCKRIRR